MVVALSGVVLGVLTAVVTRRMLLTVVVDGVSMLPTYAPGDVLLARRWGMRRVREGAVVILVGHSLQTTLRQQAERMANGEPFVAGPPGGFLVKRLLAVEGSPVPSDRVPLLAASGDRTVPVGRIVVLGDNAAASADSRVYGYLERDRLHAIVIGRIRRSGTSA